MVIDGSVKAIIFDLDGTLYHLAIDWEQVNRKLKDFQTDEDRNGYMQKMEHDGVVGGAPSLGAEEVINQLIGKYKIAVVSRNYHRTIEEALLKLGIKVPILVVGKEDVIATKPDPEGIEKALLAMGVDRSEAIFVGDTYHDVDAAKAAGVRSVVVENYRNKYKPEGADFYIAKLSDM